MLSIGEVVNGRYRIEKQLGEGGMGIVYLAWDSTLERFSALKEIKTSLPNFDRFIERIKKEAKVLARLKHDNVVNVYDLIQYRDNWYIVLEYVEGVTLDKKLEQDGALPHPKATPIFKQVLAALDHVHQAGVIHRDIKPGNVMLKSDGQVKVMDFGLAKIQTSPSAAWATHSEHTGGTLYYLPPEQVKSDGKIVDHRSDIYSFGMACYEVLAGCTPLKEKKTTVEILNAILRDNFPPPTKFNDEVPKELSKIVRKAIAVNPEKRYQSAVEMLQAVEKFEADQKKNDDPIAVKRRRVRLVLEIAWGLATVALILTLVRIFAVPDLPLRILRWAGILSPTKMVIFTEPAGAEIKFWGKSAGQSPLDSRYVDDDTLQISIQKATYFGIDTSIILKGVLEKEKVLHFDLKPAAIFSIAIEPESAEVMIDGRLIPPAERRHIELAVGEYDLHIAAVGYESISETINLRQGLNSPRLDTLKPEMLAVVAAPQVIQVKQPPVTTPKETGKVEPPPMAAETPVPTGILTLTINPPSEVYIGDSLAATAESLAGFTLPVGNYAVKVVHATMGRWQTTLAVTGAGIMREIDFTKEYEIRVLARDSAGKPLTANIYLDNQPTGKLTPDALLINFGTHQIELRLQGYQPVRREINVEKNEEREFTLEQ